MSRSVLQTIRNGMDTFSKGQKRIANYILENYDKAAFMTASKLGQTAQVSESTVVRFAAELGYNGYPDMQKELQELIRGKLTSIQRIQVSSDQMSGGDILGSVMQRDMNSIHDIIEEFGPRRVRAGGGQAAPRQAHLYSGCALVLISGGLPQLLYALYL